MRRNRLAPLSRLRPNRPHALRSSSFFRPLMEMLEARHLLASVAVNTTSDVNDGATTSIAALIAAPGADGVISLREAIIAANNTANVDGPDDDSDPDPDAIHFNIPGAGVKTITPTSVLPAITQAVVIDGYSQPGSSANTFAVGSNAVPLIELVGSGATGRAIDINANGTTLRGLIMNRFAGYAISVVSGGNTIEGNWIGIGADGNTRLENGGDIIISNSVTSANNQIGGTSPGSRNVFAGSNNNAAIMLFAGGSATIQGNYVGMNAQGTDGIGATGRIIIQTPGNLVGGTAPGAGNVISGRALELFAANNTIQGNTFGLNASGNGTLANNFLGVIIASNSIPTDNNLIGGTTAAARNVFATTQSAVQIASSSGPNVGNKIQGNYFGTNTAGTAPAGVMLSGAAIRIGGGMNNLIGGTTPGAGNVIANYPTGIDISGSSNVIQGNFIGTNAVGTSAIPNGTGISIGNHVSNNSIGGSTPGAANVISGNNSDGILIAPGGRFNTIRGNLIGLAADGISPLGNGTVGSASFRNGIRVEGADNTIGGAGPGDGNKIAFNGSSGVLLPLTFVLAGSGLRNTVLGNSIYSNGGLGIDIFGGGVTGNDLNDTDSGPNDVQNFPVITSAVTTGGTTTVRGTLNSLPNNQFRIELFSSMSADSSGNGEGQQFFGTADVSTDNSGNTTFSVSGTTPTGTIFTATATRLAAGLPLETSEFSAVRTACNLTVTNTLDSGPGSLRDAITCANQTPNVDGPDAGSDPDPDAINFNIPASDSGHVYYRNNGVAGSVSIANIAPTTASVDSAIADIDPDWAHSWWSIKPTSFVGQINSAVVIDGYTQAGATANTNGSLLGSNSILRIELNGGLGGPTGALGHTNALAVGGIGIKGLVINDWQLEGIYISEQAGGHVIAGNYIGVDVSGSLDRGNGQTGVRITSKNSVVGGTTPADRNIISGNNLNAGVSLNPQSWTGNNSVQGNFIGLGRDGVTAIGNMGNGLAVGDINTTIGGIAPGARNVIAANSFAGIAVGGFGLDVLIQGNYIGTDVTGTLDRGNGSDGVHFSTFQGSIPSRGTVGGTSPGAGNLISGNQASGITLGNTTQFVTVQGNFFGTDRTGTQAIGNSHRGITIGGGNTNLIGGTTPGAGNLISGNTLGGIFIDVANEGGNQILGNRIGTDVTGTLPVGNGFDGIWLENSTKHNTIGGTAMGAGNIIAFNARNGVTVRTSAIGQSIRGNSIHDNGALGIDLSGGSTIPNGVTPNDPGDADANTTIANTGQNYPVLTSAISNSSGTLVSGTLNSTPNTNFILDFYSSPAADPTGFGEGETYLGSTNVTTDGGGNASFTANFAVAVSAGHVVTATATDQSLYDHDNNVNTPPVPRDNTSEFSGILAVSTPQAPVITSNGGQDTASVSVPENTTTVTTVTASDPDAGTTLTYSIVGGADLGKFSINSTSGELTLDSAPNFEFPTDADANNSYLVIVQASDGNLSDSQTLTVTVTNVNEPPMITSHGGGDTASVSVSENTTTVTTVAATDPDAGTTIVYSINGGADAAQFSIDATSGALQFITAPNFEAPTDADADNMYHVVVAASDGSLSDSQTLTVTVTNTNEPPAITSHGGGDTAAIVMLENTTAVTTITAVDPDAGTTIVYSISGGADGAQFSIDATSGALQFITAPDFEAPTDADADNAYEVVVSASDGSTADSQTLSVNVVNANEAPVITSDGGGESGSISVQENTSAVTIVTALDPDAGTTITYSINGGADAAQFAIDAESGTLRFITPPDFEAQTDTDADNIYHVVVAASDGSLSDSQTLTVTVTNTNESPVITSNGGGDSATIVMPENTTAVTTVTAADPDAGATLTYSIVGGADMGKFSINATSGELTFASAPNFEFPTDADANNSYLVIVQASDGNLSDSQTLTVTVTNVNEPPMITSNGGGESASVSVPENTTAVTTVTALDPDAGTTITYSINGGADAAQFAIDAESGTLRFITPPDFEAQTDTDADNIYHVVVAASDGSLSDSQTLTVTVTNTNESPVITSNGGGDSASVSVSENTTAVTTITAADPDAGTTITYSIVGGADMGKFSINATSGELTFASAPNFELPTDADANNTYLVIVQTSDGSLSDSQTLTVTVTNANESPVITSNGGGDSASVSVPENTTAVTTVTALDPDAGTTITYSISGGADAARFSINSTSGALRFITPPNFEAPTDAGGNNIYDVMVTASDGNLTDAQSLAVAVTNANEPAVITSNGGGDSASVSVLENTTAVTTVTALDPDAGTTIVFSISGGTDAAKFSINSTSGALRFITPPNFEAPTDAGGNNIYDVMVTATDGSLTDSQLLAVAVTNANEPPVITSNGGGDSASVSVPENTTAVTTVTALDPDAGTTIVFSISGGADAAKFAINPSSGALTFITAPSFEAPTDANADNVYNVVVAASDGRASDSQVLSVNVLDTGECDGTVRLIGGVVEIRGTDGKDIVVVKRTGGSKLTVVANLNVGGGSEGGSESGAEHFSFELAAVDSIHIVLCGGSDHANVGNNGGSASGSDGELSIPSLIEGGAGDDYLTGSRAHDTLIGGPGNDKLHGREGDDTLLGEDGDDDLNGGSGQNILVGGNGNDKISGGTGRDVMIGGRDKDELMGHQGDDLLIGGFSLFDSNIPALQKIMAEWSSGRDYDTRVANLRTGSGSVLAGTGVRLKASGPGPTVFDDSSRDTLQADDGRDWFFADLDGLGGDDDKVKDKKSNETLDIISELL